MSIEDTVMIFITLEASPGDSSNPDRAANRASVADNAQIINPCHSPPR
jgi:hypothetical protein